MNRLIPCRRIHLKRCIALAVRTVRQVERRFHTAVAGEDVHRLYTRDIGVERVLRDPLEQRIVQEAKLLCADFRDQLI